MNSADIAKMRLISQQIAGTKIKTAKAIVAWMGAMQAQDYAMAKWAIGVRLPNATDQIIETAINNGEILRTHLLRPTWHIVSIEKALRGGEHLIREDLMAALGKAKIATAENRSSHLLLRAELDGIACSGATKGGKQTYALLAERVPKTKPLTKEEALAKLAKKYFTSHCPAALRDFVRFIYYPRLMNLSSATKTGAPRFLLKITTRRFPTTAYSGPLSWSTAKS
jgi:hypothetical protein